jgi:hypothetical protein
MRDGQTLWTFEGSDNPTTLHEETVLSPGDYRLLVVADTNGWIGGWEATYDVELDLSAIEAVPGLGPVAQGALALALTLSALGSHARRKRTATSNR